MKRILTLVTIVSLALSFALFNFAVFAAEPIITFEENGGTEVSEYTINTFTDFSAAVEITTDATGVQSVIAADLDNDGDMDVISANETDGTIYWHQNDGSGNFPIQFNITAIAGGPISIYAVDLDGDSWVDIVSANNADDEVVWYRNDTNNSFTKMTAISTTAMEVRSVYAADLDGDSDMDVLSANRFSNTIAWYMNDGSGVFTEQTEISTTTAAAYSVHAADLDGDLDMDVLATSFNSDSVVWFKNDGSGVFTEQTALSTTANGARSVFAADLDSDGDMDVLSASVNDHTIAWFKNDGSGEFTEQTEITTSALGASSVYAADLDSDGDMDVLSASRDDDTITWYLNDGTGSFIEQISLTTTANGASSVYAADLDGDLDMDVLSASFSDDTINKFENLGDIYQLEEPSEPTRVGYTFDDWYSDIGLTTIHDYDAFFTEEFSVYVKWEVNNYTLEFVDFDAAVLQTANYDFGVDLSLVTPPTDPTRVGYTFVEWDIVIPATMEPNDITITALYTINEYTVEYVDYNGTVLQTEDYDYNSDLSVVVPPTEPSRVGYTFDSWDITLPAIMGTSDITVTAEYTINEYDVTYSVDGTDTVVAHDYNSLLIGIPVPTKEGFTFVEWQIDSTLVNTQIYIVSNHDVTITAVFVDSDVPVISGVSDEDVDLSDADDFETPIAIVTDNVDNDLVIAVTYFKANGTTSLTNEAAAIAELELGNDVVIKYNAIDSELNEAVQVTITITLIDDIFPVIEGIEDEQIFEKKSEVTITFDEGTALLNGKEYLSGTVISEAGEYTIVVTDAYGNVTERTFTIEKSTSALFVIFIIFLILLALGGLGVGGYFYKIKIWDKREIKPKVVKEVAPVSEKLVAKKEVTPEVKKEVKPKAKKPVEKETKPAVKKATKPLVKKETKPAVKKATKPAVKKEVTPEVKKSVAKKKVTTTVKKETKPKTTKPAVKKVVKPKAAEVKKPVAKKEKVSQK